MRRGWLGVAAAFWLSAACADPTPAELVAPAEFDFYVLALSWSPGFCDLGGAHKALQQCAADAGNAFVVHGLWPDNAERADPRDCGLKPAYIPGAALASASRVYPSRALAIHEWRTHGTCTGLDAPQYIRAVQFARDALKIPEPFAHPVQAFSMAPRDIVKAFVDANDKLTDASIAVACERGELSEVRICLTRDLSDFARCPKLVRHSCRDDSVSVAPVR